MGSLQGIGMFSSVASSPTNNDAPSWLDLTKLDFSSIQLKQTLSSIRPRPTNNRLHTSTSGSSDEYAELDASSTRTRYSFTASLRRLQRKLKQPRFEDVFGYIQNALPHIRQNDTLNARRHVARSRVRKPIVRPTSYLKRGSRRMSSWRTSTFGRPASTVSTAETL
ncbi:hypothetical protein K402DRAFT_423430 [Aulographum hederae CBS 113979]|uniref:Uncharacterized protein n=1 Tax=Aulographum hederae CBS 113979 TaxID=1176131 RepID=A0A6G1GS78_9PEZI|nr:hypothetical protein K402DRAFT_423430 [Aulographum hederae CBS 113979]